MPLKIGHGGSRGFNHRHGINPGVSIGRNCVCPECHTVVTQQPGDPDFQTVCPKCGRQMTCQFQFESGEIAPPVVNPKFCTGCAKCMSVCAFEAIKIIEFKAVIESTRCPNCRACIPACPVLAIH